MKQKKVTIREALSHASRLFEECSLRSPLPDGLFILGSILHQDRAYLLAHPDQTLDRAQEKTFHDWVTKRAEHFPLQYLAGQQEFFGREFRVGPSVLIPRPETELLVEEAIFELKAREVDHPFILDVGTGSGCIAVTLACELSACRVVASDISAEALRVASENARRLGVIRQIDFLQANALEAFGPRAKRFDLIVCNPPYGDPESPDVDLSVRRFEPAQAVFAAERGLGVYRQIFRGGRKLIAPGGRLVFELGFGILPDVVRLAEAAQWKLVDMKRDLAGIQRCAVFESKNAVSGRVHPDP